jgi:hypothetical protein
MPTAKNGVATDTDADRFKCYKAKGAAVSGAGLTLADQFETKETLITTPAALCLPAHATTPQVDHPQRNLVCYKTKTAKTTPPQAKFVAQEVPTSNALGAEGVRAIKANLLCVPTLLP